MRAALVICSLGLALAAGVGHAQTMPPPSVIDRSGLNLQDRLRIEGELAQMRTEQQSAQRQLLFQQNELNALQGNVRTEQALGQLRAQTQPVTAPPRAAGAAPSSLDAGQFASMPDASLAASNARVRAAANNHR